MCTHFSCTFEVYLPKIRIHYNSSCWTEVSVDPKIIKHKARNGLMVFLMHMDPLSYHTKIGRASHAHIRAQSLQSSGLAVNRGQKSRLSDWAQIKILLWNFHMLIPKWYRNPKKKKNWRFFYCKRSKFCLDVIILNFSNDEKLSILLRFWIAIPFWNQHMQVS